LRGSVSHFGPLFRLEVHDQFLRIWDRGSRKWDKLHGNEIDIKRRFL
jgi:hypothetical protein